MRPTQQDPEESTVKPGRQEHFHSHHPSTWCITPKQLYELEGLVEQTWPGEQDPSTRHVVRDFIVPKTEKSGLSSTLKDYERQGVANLLRLPFQD
eukprot:g17126.t1